jgi:DNA-binding NtrC family response regulator
MHQRPFDARRRLQIHQTALNRQDLAQSLGVATRDRDLVRDGTLQGYVLGSYSARKLGLPPPRLAAAQIKELQAYDWPGNVRELQNVIERAAIRSRNGPLELALARVSPRSSSRKIEIGSQSGPASLSEIKEHERNVILDALAKTRGKIYGPDGAAALLGLKPTTLSSRVHRMGLKKFVAERR